MNPRKNPSKDIVASYVIEAVPDATNDQKSRAVKYLLKMLNDSITVEEATTNIYNILGTTGPADKVRLILEVKEEPLRPSNENKEFWKKSGRRIARKWSTEEDTRLLAAIIRFGEHDWDNISKFVGSSRSIAQCSQRWSRGLNPTINTNQWSEDENRLLESLVKKYGSKSWKKISTKMKNRSDAQCRYHYLKIVKKGKTDTKDIPKTKKNLLDMNQQIINGFSFQMNNSMGQLPYDFQERFNQFQLKQKEPSFIFSVEEYEAFKYRLGEINSSTMECL